jgi:hypothetical protein
MHEGNPFIRGAGRAASIWLATFIVFSTTSPCAALAASHAGAKPSTSEEASPKQIQELTTLLADPKVRNWLEQQAKAEAASERAATEESVSQALDSRLGAIREHIVALAGTVPDLPNQFWQGRARVTADLGENGRIKALLLLAVFVGLGIGVEWLFRKVTQPPRCAPLGNGAGALAYRRAALRVCGRAGRGVCARQHRSLPCVRLAAVAA